MKKDTFDTFKAIEQRYRELKEEISTDAIMVAKNVAKIRGEDFNGSSYSVEFTEESVMITAYNNNDDFDSIDYPIEYLWNKDYCELEQQREEIRKQEIDLLNSKLSKEREAKEYEQYLAMKRKYEDG